MALQSITNISVDFCDKKYILINAKQLDKKTRFLSVACYNHGEFLFADPRYHGAYIRYKKADEYGVFNFCEITKDGKILVELTEQMLAVTGICYADLVIVNRGQAEVDAETGEIINIDNASVLSTMTFCIDVSETAVDNSEIESSYEYSAFNQSLENYWADFEEVMQTSKSYAIGNAGGIRPNEDTDNAKYYYEQSLSKANEASNSAIASATSAENAAASASAANTSAINASNSESNAKTYMNKAGEYMSAAKTSETNAGESAEQSESFAVTSQRYAVGGTGTVESEDKDNAKYYYEQALVQAGESANSATASANSALSASQSADAAANSATASANSASDSAASASAANTSAINASNSESNAKTYMNKAGEYMSSAKVSENNAAESASDAYDYSVAAQSSMNSAAESATSASTSKTDTYNYYLQAETIVNSLDGAFRPKGTITFAELIELKNNGTVAASDLYQISDDFTTDENFKVSGKVCGAGTSVYYTVDDKFDVFVGATVSGVKGEKETVYRTGMVNVTVENIGAIPSENIATVDEVMSYLGI